VRVRLQVLRLQELRYFPTARLGPLWVQEGQLALDLAEVLSGVLESGGQ
jgi:hypothetical protein